MKNHHLILAALVSLVLSAFLPAEQTQITGTYGVSESNPANIELVLNEDLSFSYQDHSVAAEKIEVSGTWEIKNKRIILKSDSDIAFHSKWKITQDGEVAKSRKGMTFYTIRKK